MLLLFVLSPCRTFWQIRRSSRELVVAFSSPGNWYAAPQVGRFWRSSCVFCGCSVQLLPVPITQDSMISRCLLTSSSCTGAFTAEASLAVVEKTIRDSGFFSRPPSFRCICCFVARIRLSRFWQACCLVHVTLAFGVALVREQQNQGEGCPLSAADSGQPLVEHFRDRQPHASALHLF